MPTYILYSCPRCGSHVDHQDAYYSIGEPFVICPKCNLPVDISNNRTEWELKTPIQRFGFQAKVIFISAFLGFGAGAIVSELIAPEVGIPLPLPITAAICTAIWFWILGRDMRQSIADSKSRMEDPRYRNFVTSLLKDSNKRRI